MSVVVEVGATFANDSLAKCFLKINEVLQWGNRVQYKWQPYGVCRSSFSSKGTQLPTAKVDLCIWVIRLDDIFISHPELSKEEGQPPSEQLIQQKINNLLVHLTSASQHLLVICPSTTITENEEAFFLSYISQSITENSELHKRISIIQPKQLYDSYGIADCYDELMDITTHCPYTQEMMQVIAIFCCRFINQFFLKPPPKKVIVLDCDNTLWGGVVGEVGPEGVRLSPPYLFLQQFMIRQHARGMLLCLSSKNVLKDVESIFTSRESEMPVKLKDHVALAKVNWNNKSTNIREIADALSLGLDSIIFVDDNPIECSEVRECCPEVTVLQLPENENNFATFLENCWNFDMKPLLLHCASEIECLITTEDTFRSLFYIMNAKRDKLQEQSSSHDIFLANLNVQIDISKCDFSNIDRVVQLLSRTNQFNCSGERFSKKEVLKRLEDIDNHVFTVKVTDRFGCYGIVGVVLICFRDDMVLVENFVLSCRALNRGVEHAMLKEIARLCKCNSNFDKFYIQWKETNRNEPAKRFCSSVSNLCLLSALDLNLSIADTSYWRVSIVDALNLSFLAERSKPSCQSGGYIVNLLFAGIFIIQSIFSHLLNHYIYTFFNFKVRDSEYLKSIQKNRDNLLVPLYCQLTMSKFFQNSIESSADYHTSDKIPGTESMMTSFSQSDEFTNICKLRRKYRYQAKVLLTDHVEKPELDSIVWSANQEIIGPKITENCPGLRKVTDEADKQVFICAKANHRMKKCLFGRCRGCCYRIQQAQNRFYNGSGVHEKEKQIAFEFLNRNVQYQDQFSKHCHVHVNPRRCFKSISANHT